jgi:hypothetical protein
MAARRHPGRVDRAPASAGGGARLDDAELLLDPEHLYAWPLSTVARLLMFIYVILSRYVGAVDEAEQANARLARKA